MSSLFATCVGHTMAFGDQAKAYIGLAGLFVGIGEVLGSCTVFLKRWLPSDGIMCLFGYVPGLTGVLIFFLNLPGNSPMTDSNEQTYITPNPALCMLVSCFLGMVDSVWNTQLSSAISTIYRDDETNLTVTFSLFRFVHALMAAVTFAYCGYLALLGHVLIYAAWATVSMGNFFYVYRKYYKPITRQRQSSSRIEKTEDAISYTTAV
ncbi:unnamed protein product [Echinostoma caproni]|uniref:Solute carrier family 40 protein n=1 Tax=Echinostoma caproni TaxID=27848 RepID=A0A183AE46_9TREM|nr:unnamed protein product [Echinostoma caproni]